MAENDHLEEEYQYTDPDEVVPAESEGEAPKVETKAVPTEPKLKVTPNIRRNALIAVGVVVFIMIAYKLLSGHHDKQMDTIQPETPASAEPTQVNSQPAVQTPSAPEPQAAVTPQAEQKLSALELNQQNTRSEVEAVSNQLNTMNGNVTSLAAQVGQLNQLISELQSKIEQQSVEVNQLIEKSKPKPVRHHVQKNRTPAKKYFIQAIIPGRAWLVASNGSTLTVREGSVIPGLGTVRIIDPNQGRVTLSSGQVIRFSQEDS